MLFFLFSPAPPLSPLKICVFTIQQIHIQKYSFPQQQKKEKEKNIADAHATRVSVYVFVSTSLRNKCVPSSHTQQICNCGTATNDRIIFTFSFQRWRKIGINNSYSRIQVSIGLQFTQIEKSDRNVMRRSGKCRRSGEIACAQSTAQHILCE